MARSFQTLTRGQKQELCQYADQNPTVSQKHLIAWMEEKHNVKISQSTVSMLLKHKKQWLEPISRSQAMTKRICTPKYPLLDQALLTWFIASEGRVNMSGNLIKEKGQLFFEALYPGQTPISFSNGWLESFKHRHEIKEYRRFGDNSGVGMEQAVAQLPAIKVRITQYPRHDIYSMAETGLFFRLSGDRTIATQQLAGRATRKERFTIVFCANADGTDRCPLAVISTYNQPHCLQNVNLQNLGVDYYSTESGWMSKDVFSLWLMRFDARMMGRRVLLLVSSSSGHTTPGALDFPFLQNTELVILPTDNIPKLQPYDLGIFKIFKSFYRRRQFRLFQENATNGEPNPEKISLREGIRMTAAAWHETDASTIHSSFSQSVLFDDDKQPELGPDPAVIMEITDLLQARGYASPLNVNVLLEYPGESASILSLGDQEIINRVLASTPDTPQDTSLDDAGNAPPISATLGDARKACVCIQNYILEQPDADNSMLLPLLFDLENKLYMKKIMPPDHMPPEHMPPEHMPPDQSRITDFFIAQ